MDHHKRNLPHYYPSEAILFVTWRLFGSLQLDRMAAKSPPDAGREFLENDRLLDRSTDGPLWLGHPAVASLVAATLQRGHIEYGLYELYAWVIMPNHVHAVMRLYPSRNLPQIMRWIKGSTARASNLRLGRAGKQFWQYESYDHCVRNDNELNRIIHYVERNPVMAGLAEAIDDWPWSSASAGRKACSTTNRLPL
ncbi:MAG: transposase [Bryobacteraceae bacterium]|jgi:putative DNA methylase